MVRRSMLANISANPWGFFDMHGTVGKATSGRYYTYAEDPVADPVGTRRLVSVSQGGLLESGGSLFVLLVD